MDNEFKRKHTPLKDKINVIYEDAAIIVIDKASGVITQPVKDSNEESAIDLIRQYWKTKNKKQHYLGVIHRLDKETSGVLVITKNREAQAILQQQFVHHKISKRYLAITDGIPHNPRGRLVGFIYRDEKGRRNIQKTSEDGKEAITRYKIIETYNHKSLLELAPETGRAHQIRLQLSKIGCPIIGEPFYTREKKRVPGCQRCALHAESIEFIHPDTAKRIKFEAPMPKDMMNIIAKEKSDMRKLENAKIPKSDSKRMEK